VQKGCLLDSLFAGEGSNTIAMLFTGITALDREDEYFFMEDYLVNSQLIDTMFGIALV